MRSKLVPMMLDHARAVGIETDALADRLGIPPPCRSNASWTLDAPAIPIDRVRALADELRERLGDPHLGLSLAANLQRGVYGVQEFAVRNSPTIGEAALRLVRYQRLTNDAIVWGAEHDERGCALTHHVPAAPDGLGPVLNEFSLAAAMRYLRELSQHPHDAVGIRFAHTERPSRLDALRALFGTERFVFGAGRNVLELRPEVWTWPVPQADAALLPLLEGYAAAALPPEDPSASWRNRVRDHLRRNLSGGPPTIDQVADAIGTTDRSLQRYLAEGGTSYRAVLDELRREQARQLLASSEASVGEISFLLGYAERRAFLRAFRRWEDATPTAWRRRARS